MPNGNETPLDRAIRAVASVCAIMTHFVKITGIDPLEVSPNNLAFLTFANVGISDMDTFKKLLAHALPSELSKPIGELQLAPGLKIGLVINMVEALLVNM